MSFKEFMLKVLTPKDTEEIKPGLFIQTKYSEIRHKGDMISREPVEYRRVIPLAWDGKYLWKKQLKTVFCLRTFITMAIILFVVWSYVHDVREYKEFYVEVMEDPKEFCYTLSELKEGATCTDKWMEMGLCQERSDLNISRFGVDE